MRFLLDTDTCVFWLRGHSLLRDRMTRVLEDNGAAEIALSVVTLAELRYGAAYSSRPTENHQAIDDFVSALMILTLTPETAKVFGEIKADLRTRGLLIEDLDLLIAATARAYDLTLVTNNQSHFSRVPGLRLENWVQT